MKKFVSIVLCAVLAAGAAVTANAKTIKQSSAVEVLGVWQNIPNDTLLVSAYNLPDDYEEGVLFEGGDTKTEYKMAFKDCVNGDKTLFIPSTEKYARYFMLGSGNSYPSYSFTKTGGKYVKIKVKLSEVAPNYFNEDGSHTTSYSVYNNHDFKFKKESLNDYEYYNSALYIQSGGAVSGVVPDENGCVEINLSTKVNCRTEYCTKFSCRTYTTISGGGGVTGNGIEMLKFGNITLRGGVDVNDVTMLQQYLSGKNNVEFDSLQYFYADINLDGKRDVRDVTALQKGIAAS